MIIHALYILIAIAGFILLCFGLLKRLKVADIPIIQRFKLIDQKTPFSIKTEGKHVIGIDWANHVRWGNQLSLQVISVDSNNTTPITPTYWPIVSSTEMDGIYDLAQFTIPEKGEYILECNNTHDLMCYTVLFQLIDHSELTLVLRPVPNLFPRWRAIGLTAPGFILMVLGIVFSLS